MNDPYIKNLKVTVFDIETSGLLPTGSGVISASFCDPQTMQLKQFFCDAPQCEAALITSVIDELSNYDAVVTYNGDAFDFRFLTSRSRHHRLCERLPFFWSVDIYRRLKKYWPAAERMTHLNQKSVEEAFGISQLRTDEKGGKDCIELYSRFLNLADESAKELILLHNGDDVRQLARIFNALNFLPWDEIAFNEGYLFKGRFLPVMQKKLKLAENTLSASAYMAPGLLPASIYADNYHLEYDSKTGSIDLTIYLQKKDPYIFADLDEFNLEDEDVLSLGQLPETKDGFLILKDHDKINYRAANRLVHTVLMRL